MCCLKRWADDAQVAKSKTGALMRNVIKVDGSEGERMKALSLSWPREETGSSKEAASKRRRAWLP